MAKYFVVYRVGGLLNFSWKCSSACYTPQDASNVFHAVKRMGFAAMVVDSRLIDAVGMPDKYGATYDSYYHRAVGA